MNNPGRATAPLRSFFPQTLTSETLRVLVQALDLQTAPPPGRTG